MVAHARAHTHAHTHTRTHTHKHTQTRNRPYYKHTESFLVSWAKPERGDEVSRHRQGDKGRGGHRGGSILVNGQCFGCPPAPMDARMAGVEAEVASMNVKLEAIQAQLALLLERGI